MATALSRPSEDSGEQLQTLLGDTSAWLRDLVFAGEEGAGVQYLVLPSLARPRIVLPDRGANTYRGLMAIGGSGGLHKRAIRAAAGAGLMLGGGRLVGDRLEGPAGTGLGAVLREMVPETDALSIRLGTLRPNAKPVVALLDRDGRVRGFAKVGWNSVSRGLVADEAEALRHLRVEHPRFLRSPRLLRVRLWRDFLISVQEALPVPTVRRSRATTAVAAAALRDIAGDISPREMLKNSGYLDGSVDRLRTIAEARHRATAERFLVGLQRRCGRLPVSLGRWHGDFTPWNSAMVGGRMLVWDWERSAAGVPLGLDALHYHTSPEDLAAYPFRTVDQAAARAQPWMEALGLAPDSLQGLSRIHLFELYLRHRTDGDGVETPGRRRLLAALESALAQLLEV